MKERKKERENEKNTLGALRWRMEIRAKEVESCHQLFPSFFASVQSDLFAVVCWGALSA